MFQDIPTYCLSESIGEDALICEDRGFLVMMDDQIPPQPSPTPSPSPTPTQPKKPREPAA